MVRVQGWGIYKYVVLVFSRYLELDIIILHVCAVACLN